MPSERSLYRKIQLVLDVAKAVRVSSLRELQEKVGDRRYPNFYSTRYDSSKDAFFEDVSEQMIRRTLRICRLVKLITEEGRLTKQGRAALQKVRFEKIVAQRVREVFRANGVETAEMNRIIRRSFRRNPPVLPTCRYLWEEIDTELGYGIFSRMMTLLAQCNGATGSQRKIYLNIEPG